MTYTTTLTSKWQMTLPKAVREQLGITKPGQVEVGVVDKAKNLVRVEKTPDILDLAGSIPAKNTKGKDIDNLDIREYMEKNYRRF